MTAPTSTAQLRVGAEPAGGTEPGACLVAGCERRRKARGWCPMHYARWLRHGDPLTIKHHIGDVSKFDTVGISYRQLDYWTSRGYLKCLVANPGSGYQRTWSDEEREIAARMQALLDLGVTLGAAARIARHEKAQTVLAVLSEAMSA